MQSAKPSPGRCPASMSAASRYYERSGSGEPVVFSHGVPTDYRALGAQADALSKRYSTIAYSRRYAAPNRREGDVGDSMVEANASDLKGFLEELGVAPTHLVGHSYGASSPPTCRPTTPTWSAASSWSSPLSRLC